MIFLLLFGLAGLIGAVLWLLTIYVSASPGVKSWTPWAYAILAGYGLAYVIGLIWVSVNPLWETGKVEIWAEFPEHLVWAIPVMAYTQFFCVPLAVAILALHRRLRPPP